MKKILFNPLKRDFSVNYDINGNGKPLTFTARSMTITRFDEPIYDHVKKHLITEILNERELNPTIPKNTEDIIKEIEHYGD